MLDDGRVVEYDSPSRLIADKKSLFFTLANDAGFSL